MSHITVDAALASQLSQVPEPIELRDPSGRVVGYFTPEVGPELTEEEEEQIYKENKWYTFDEVMAHLKSLEQQ